MCHDIITASQISSSPRTGKILVFCNDFNYFIHHRISALQKLRKSGMAVYVYCDANHGRHRELDGIIFNDIVCNRFGFSPIQDIRLFASLFSALRKEAPDVVQTITMKPNLYGGLAVRLYNLLFRRDVRLVMTNPGLGRLFASGGRRGEWIRRIATFAFKVALAPPSAHVVFENVGDRRHWVRLGIVKRERTSIVRGAGIEFDDYSMKRERDPTGPTRILFAGRLIYQKGIGVFLEAAKNVLAHDANVEFWIAGASDPIDPDHFPVHLNTSVDPRIKFLGHTSDMPKVLSEVDIVCLPTVYGEGIPRILIEAAATGLAIVASDQIGCRAIVRDMVTGRLVPRRDGKVNSKELSDMLFWLLENPEMVKIFGQRAREFVIQNGFDQCSIDENYSSIILQ
ncbi:MAG: glycosyltransferase family 4 protein [Notoacmeibacter sp.]|nr:glycosyltransferase family 4 protein [Notoacmeibacter sp.]